MSFYVDDDGTLKVFNNNTLLAEVQNCQEMTEGEIQCLADEIYRDYMED